MKSKYYPHLTILVATLLIVLPLLVLSLSLADSSPDTEIAFDQPAGGPLDEPSGAPRTPMQPTQSRLSDMGSHEAPLTLTNSRTTSLPSIPKTASAKPEPIPQPQIIPEVAVANPVVVNSVHSVPQPVDAIELEMSESELHQQAELANTAQDAAVVADNGMQEPPSRTDAGASYYEATGHLAMRDQPQIPDQTTNSAEPTSQNAPAQSTPDTGDVTSAKIPKSKGRKSKSNEKDSGETIADIVNSVSQQPLDLNNPRTKATEKGDKLIEDVAIQTPLESSPVGRVENVVAMTRAKGWPIALIKSDLPDDVWWVQQVVGIQGNSFAARVNFGNEYSLSGSAFDMVIVFLDSPDEVRRFRIAKQFKEIPKGVRHSREFHYIRN